MKKAIARMLGKSESSADVALSTLDRLVAELEKYGRPTLYKNERGGWRCYVDFDVPIGLASKAEVPLGQRANTAVEACQIVLGIIRKNFPAC